LSEKRELGRYSQSGGMKGMWKCVSLFILNI